MIMMMMGSEEFGKIEKLKVDRKKERKLVGP